MYAVIKSGDKQYKVTKGQIVEVELLKAKAGEEVKFDVLMTGEGAEIKVGNPVLESASVKGKVLGEIKADKVVAYRYAAKKNIRKKQGHRQAYTRVQITDIV